MFNVWYLHDTHENSYPARLLKVNSFSFLHFKGMECMPLQNNHYIGNEGHFYSTCMIYGVVNFTSTVE